MKLCRTWSLSPPRLLLLPWLVFSYATFSERRQHLDIFSSWKGSKLKLILYPSSYRIGNAVFLDFECDLHGNVTACSGEQFWSHMVKKAVERVLHGIVAIHLCWSADELSRDEMTMALRVMWNHNASALIEGLFYNSPLIDILRFIMEEVLNFKISKSWTVIPKVIDVYHKEVQREYWVIAQDDNDTFILLIIRYNGMVMVYSAYSVVELWIQTS
jgi:hypothetical protein